MFSPPKANGIEKTGGGGISSPKRTLKTPRSLIKPVQPPRTPPRTPKSNEATTPQTSSSTSSSSFITSSPRSPPNARKVTKPSSTGFQRLARTASASMFSPSYKKAGANTTACTWERKSAEDTGFPTTPLSPSRQRLEQNVAIYGNHPQQFDEYDPEEFDPYRFIASLPPLNPNRVVNACLPPKSLGEHRVTLVLDLDETLVHCTTDPNEMPNADFQFDVEFNSMLYKVNCKKRPGFEEFLEHVADMFEIVVFTASQRVYADKLLDIIDGKHKFIKHRIFREDCLCMEGNYLKDLTVLNRDMATTVILDNSPQAFSYQLDNGIPILSWFDSDEDRELYKIVPFLESLAGAADVRPLVRNRFALWKRVADNKAKFWKAAG